MTSVLCLINAQRQHTAVQKDAYTCEITFLALYPWTAYFSFDFYQGIIHQRHKKSKQSEDVNLKLQGYPDPQKTF